MNEICIKSKYMTKLLSAILKKVIKNKLSCTSEVQLNSLCVTTTDNCVKVHIDSDLTLTKEELDKLIKMYLKE